MNKTYQDMRYQIVIATPARKHDGKEGKGKQITWLVKHLHLCVHFKTSDGEWMLKWQQLLGNIITQFYFVTAVQARGGGTSPFFW